MIATPWGEIEIADAHVHFFSPEFFRSLAEQKNSKGSEGITEIGAILEWQIPESPEYLADRWVIELNHNGVGKRRPDREFSGRRGIGGHCRRTASRALPFRRHDEPAACWRGYPLPERP